MLLPLYAQAAASTGTGTAQGYGGDVIVTLTVSGGRRSCRSEQPAAPAKAERRRPCGAGED